MGSASKVMYTIGKVFNVIEMVISVLIIILGGVFGIIAENASGNKT